MARTIGLADTTGYSNPVQLKNMIKAVWNTVGKEKMTGVHLHNTRGQGLANVLAALDVGIKTFDSSLGGLGGCPFAPGASGNIVTEDLVFLLDSMGVKTGINLEKLLMSRSHVLNALPDEEMYGFVSESGLPKDYVSTLDGGKGWA